MSEDLTLPPNDRVQEDIDELVEKAEELGYECWRENQTAVRCELEDSGIGIRISEQVVR